MRRGPMSPGEKLPKHFLEQIYALQDAYLADDDPIRQSGFGGGTERWRREREPILNAVEMDGDFVDVGCANGYLLECLLEWAHDRGLRLIPYGVDIGPKLIELAKKRLPEFASNFYVGNGWDWQPKQRFWYVYSLADSVPESYVDAYVRRLLEHVVEPNGRLIIGHYGSRSRGTAPLSIADLLASSGYKVAGSAWGGDPPVSHFAWVDNSAVG